MNIYKIEYPEGRRNWDEIYQQIVVAPTERSAREVAGARAMDEGSGVWFDSSQTTCSEIGTTDKWKEPEVISWMLNNG